jgi:hypothetical protein
MSSRSSSGRGELPTIPGGPHPVPVHLPPAHWFYYVSFAALLHRVHLVHASLEGQRTQHSERLLKVSVRFGEAEELDVFNADLAWGRLRLEDLHGLFDVIL